MGGGLTPNSVYSLYKSVSGAKKSNAHLIYNNFREEEDRELISQFITILTSGAPEQVTLSNFVKKKLMPMTL